MFGLVSELSKNNLNTANNKNCNTSIIFFEEQFILHKDRGINYKSNALVFNKIVFYKDHAHIFYRSQVETSKNAFRILNSEALGVKNWHFFCSAFFL